MRTTESLFNKIVNYIKTYGRLINRAKSDWGADIWELKGVYVSETDCGYYTRVYTLSYSYEMNHGNGALFEQIKGQNPTSIRPEQLAEVMEFLRNSIQPFEKTLPESFWLAKFKKDYPADHIDNHSAIKYDFTKL